ncbi:MAG TPA: glycoside hydrolase family 20 zincin-like fold domain-containing protein, partial [Usitatibacter sp.]|nr:glycoside hydrolase family 20 zincin-like fold domain-containing protein [Usitatibacter sp.]
MTALLLHAAPLAHAGEPALVPRPASLEMTEGMFRLSSSTPIVVPPDDAAAATAAEVLRERLQRSRGFAPAIVHGAARDGAIVF